MKETRRRHLRSRSALAVLAGLALSACQGSVADDDDAGGGGSGVVPDLPVETIPIPGTDLVIAPAPAAACSTPAGASPLRRLNVFEYGNTLRDLFGSDFGAPALLPPDARGNGFDNNADALAVGDNLVAQHFQAAEQVADQVMRNPASVLPCDPAAAGEDACAARFIAEFGARAFRRPLDDQEKTRLFALYQREQARPFVKRVEMVLQAMLISPQFLYRLEFGAPVEGSTLAPLSSYEVASRLSYLFWGSMPDPELFRAAAAGELAEASAVLAQGQRLLADARGREVAWRFHEQWLQFDAIDAIEKTGFNSWRPELRPLLKQEARALIEDVLWNGSGEFAAMLTAPYTFVNATLGAYYASEASIAAPPTGNAFVRVELDPSKRAGFLTQAGLMAAVARADRTSIVRRGNYIRSRLMCSSPPPPPDNVDQSLPAPPAGATARSQAEQRVARTECGVCHRLIDPIGYGFENYDAIGRWRTVDNGAPIDPSGEIFEADIAGRFAGPIELVGKLAQSAEVRACTGNTMFRFAYGRAEGTADACTLAQLGATLDANRGNLRAALLALTQTPAFRWKVVGGVP